MPATIKINAKCSDCFCASLHEEGKEVRHYDGYVPDFFPGQHYGDYIQLEIDANTGKILNWEPPTSNELDKVFSVEDSK
jgi:hypothetical protein